MGDPTPVHKLHHSSDRTAVETVVYRVSATVDSPQLHSCACMGSLARAAGTPSDGLFAIRESPLCTTGGGSRTILRGRGGGVTCS